MDRPRLVAATSALVAMAIVDGCARPQRGPVVVPPIVVETEPLPAVAVAVALLGDRTGRRADEVGRAQAGALNTKVPLTSPTPMAETVTRALADALTAAGARVGPPHQADVVIGGAITTLWVHEYVTGYSLEHATANIQVELEFTDVVGHRLGGTTLKVELDSPDILDATTADLPTLGQAIADVGRALARDVGLRRILEARAVNKPIEPDN